jgi:putative transcriptional regulator
MSKQAFDSIRAGLEDAIAHRAGEPGRGRVTAVAPPEFNVRELRERLGLTQEEFAAAFAVSVGTVRNWEQGRREPQGPARVLLAVIAREPDAVRRAITTAA